MVDGLGFKDTRVWGVESCVEDSHKRKMLAMISPYYIMGTTFGDLMFGVGVGGSSLGSC